MSGTIFDYFVQFNGLTSGQQMFDCFVSIMSEFGFTAINYSYIQPNDQGGAPEVSCHDTFGAQWHQHYRDNGFEQHDYLIAELDRQDWRPFVHDADRLPSRIAENPDHMRVIEAASQFGWPRCFLVPIKSVGEGHGAITLATNLSTEAFDSLIAEHEEILVALSFYAHQLMKQIHESVGIASIQQLTPQQKRVVELLSEGKSNKEISHILEISEPSVSFHLKGAKERLQVRTVREIIPAYLSSQNLLH